MMMVFGSAQGSADAQPLACTATCYFITCKSSEQRSGSLQRRLSEPVPHYTSAGECRELGSNSTKMRKKHDVGPSLSKPHSLHDIIIQPRRRRDGRSGLRGAMCNPPNRQSRHWQTRW